MHRQRRPGQLLKINKDGNELDEKIKDNCADDMLDDVTNSG